MSTIPGLPLLGSVRVLIAAKPVDFRKGADGLAALAKEVLAQDPFICVGRGYVAAWSRSA
jgi:transposase